MQNSGDWRDWLRRPSKQRSTLFIIAGVFLVIFLLQTGLNLWVRSLLSHQLIENGGAGFQLQASMGWMKLTDLIRGKLKRIHLESKNCIISGLRYQYLRVDNEWLDFDLPLLIRERQLRLERIGTTKVQGIISETALSDYLNLNYPEFQPKTVILPGRIRISGKVSIFGRMTDIMLEERVETSGPKTIRFFTESISIGGKQVPSDLVKLITTQIPLNFSVMEDWPLKITKLQLTKGQLEIHLEEMTS
ncbi:MAG TPA: LmeA family phospholipid-binding protein [Bacillota bacterium]|nr:LmeA family phospholipid-binding protein [Bacillota bacterium]HPT87932.1 LmeA family phospholipid-binding protein [Bacillota bacterium]